MFFPFIVSCIRHRRKQGLKFVMGASKKLQFLETGEFERVYRKISYFQITIFRLSVKELMQKKGFRGTDFSL